MTQPAAKSARRLYRLFAVPVLVGVALAGMAGGAVQEAKAGRLSHDWSYALYGQAMLEAGVKEFTQPTFLAGGDRLVVGDRNGTLWMFDMRAKSVLWKRSLSGAVVAAPIEVALKDKKKGLLVGDTSGRLRMLSLEDGTDLWPAPLASQGSFRSRPLVHGPLVVAVDSANRVLATTVEGRFLFDVGVRPPEEFSLFGDCTPATDGQRLYIGFSDGTVAALDPVRGQRLWEATLPTTATKMRDAQAGPIIVGEHIWVGGPHCGLSVLRRQDGTQEHHIPMEGIIGLYPAGPEEFYALTWDGTITRFGKSADGKPNASWSTQVKGAPGVPALTDKSLVFCNGTGIVSISRKDGAVDDYLGFSNGCGSGVAVAPGQVAFVTGEGVLRVYDITEGRTE